MLRSLLPLALLLTGALTLAPQDPPPAVAAGEVPPTSPSLQTQFTHLLDSGVWAQDAWIQGILSLTPTYLEPDTGSAVRIVICSTMCKVGTVLLTEEHSFQAVAVSSNEAIESIVYPVNTGSAKAFAYEVVEGPLDEEELEVFESYVAGGQESGRYRLTATPREGLVWGAVSTPDDLVFDIEPAPEDD